MGEITLLTEIQTLLTTPEVDLATVLRKALILASRLGNQEFKEWVQSELQGYPGEAPVPDYRVLHLQSVGTFSGPGGGGMKNAPIPYSNVPEEERCLRFGG